MKRFKVYISIGLDEQDFGTTHYHEKRMKVLDFGDSKPEALKKYKEIEELFVSLFEKK